MSENFKKILGGLKGILPYFATPAMLVFIIWQAAEFKTKSESVQFSTLENKIETEAFFEKYDASEVIEASTKEYILDSIEEVETQEFRKYQIAKNKEIDSLLRLSIRIIDNVKKSRNP